MTGTVQQEDRVLPQREKRVKTPATTRDPRSNTRMRHSTGALPTSMSGLFSTLGSSGSFATTPEICDQSGTGDLCPKSRTCYHDGVAMLLPKRYALRLRCAIMPSTGMCPMDIHQVCLEILPIPTLAILRDLHLGLTMRTSVRLDVPPEENVRLNFCATLEISNVKS